MIPVFISTRTHQKRMGFRHRSAFNLLQVVTKTRHIHQTSHPSLKLSIATLLSSPQTTHPNHDVSVRGWIRSVRKLKNVAFAAVADGSCFRPLQVVLTPNQAKGLSAGTGVRIRGIWMSSELGKEQSKELRASEIEILGPTDASTYPLQKKYHSPEYLRTIPHLRVRTPKNSLILRLRSQLIAQISAFFTARNFIQTHPPIITSSDCEGAGEVFKINANSSHPDSATNNHQKSTGSSGFFGTPKYLTVSSQLHLEALAQSVGNVWTLSPSFRADKSDTSRHLSEFYMLEAEMSFAESLEDIMTLLEQLLFEIATSLQKSSIGHEMLLAESQDELHQNSEFGSDMVTLPSAESQLLKRWSKLSQPSWPRITYAEAISFLQDAAENQKVAFRFAPTWESGLQAEHERYLTSSVAGGGPVFVTDYPGFLKPFYMPLSATDPSAKRSTFPSPTVACFDLLLPDICEVAGGSMREHRLPELLSAMKSHGLVKNINPNRLSDHDLGSFKWYVDLRQWGSVPHGGFGLGFDRLLAFLTGVDNVRDVVAFPRWAGRCDC